MAQDMIQPSNGPPISIELQITSRHRGRINRCCRRRNYFLNRTEAREYRSLFRP